MSTSVNNPFDKNDKIECLLCGVKLHQLAVHLGSKHNTNVETYLEKFPGSPTVSKFAQWQISQAQQNKGAMTAVKKSLTAKAAKADSAQDMGGTVLQFGVAQLAVRESLNEYEQAFVPLHDPHYEINDKLFEELAQGVEEGDNVFIYGPTGCGKSTGVLELAAIVNQPVIRINMDGDTRTSDFLGEKIVDIDPDTGKQVVTWQDGALPMAARRGFWLIIDEVSAAPAAILFALQAVLEGMPLMLKGNGGEIVPLHKNFRIFCTDNTCGKGDGGATFTGTNVLNEAFLDRFGTNIHADYLPKGQEVKVLVAKTGIDAKVADLMVDVAREIRTSFEKDDTLATFSTRRLIDWAAKTMKFDGDHKRGAKVAFMSRLLKDDAGFVEDVIQRILG